MIASDCITVLNFMILCMYVWEYCTVQLSPFKWYYCTMQSVAVWSLYNSIAMHNIVYLCDNMKWYGSILLCDSITFYYNITLCDDTTILDGICLLLCLLLILGYLYNKALEVWSIMVFSVHISFLYDFLYFAYGILMYRTLCLHLCGQIGYCVHICSLHNSDYHMYKFKRALFWSFL